MRVLVIEDDTTLGHALQEFLADQGYAVDWLTEGDRVLGALAGQPYDLMLLDLNLPGMSGLDVLRQLRQDGNQVPAWMPAPTTTSPHLSNCPSWRHACAPSAAAAPARRSR
ncbi:hypothetical protein G6F40_016987 [Rhizopus arrhizus]|nr:hypothetical protein G6F40_016987 [Rhizopus arrhizus]